MHCSSPGALTATAVVQQRGPHNVNTLPAGASFVRAPRISYSTLAHPPSACAAPPLSHGSRAKFSRP